MYLLQGFLLRYLFHQVIERFCSITYRMSCRVFFFSRGLREVLEARISGRKSAEYPKISLKEFSWKPAADFVS